MTDSINIFTNTANAIVSFQGILIFSVSIVLIALFCYFLGFKRKITPLIQQFENALMKIRNASGIENFSSDFHEIDVWMREQNFLCHLWSEFSETLIMPSATAAKKEICNTEQASNFFNEESVTADKINLRFYNSIPNWLTGSGILGTFIGLVAGIYLASKGLASDDSTELNNALHSLLSGACLAFMTSIVGIASSILFSWREKHLTYRLKIVLNDFNRELDSRIVRLPAEYLAKEQLSHLERQTDYLEEFTTNVAYNIAHALGDRLNERLVPTLERLEEAVNKMRLERSHSNDELLEKIVEQFTQGLTGAAGEEINALSKTLSSLKETMEPILDEMKDSRAQMREAYSKMQGAAIFMADKISESYNESGRKFAEELEHALNILKSGITQVGDDLNNSLKEAFNQTVDRLEATIENMDKSIANLGKTGKDTEEVVSKVSILFDRFDTAVFKLSDLEKQMEETIHALENSAKNIGDGGDATKIAVGHLKTTMDLFQENVNKFETSQENIVKNWNEYASRFEDLDKTLEKVFKEITNGLLQYSEQTNHYMTSMDLHAKTVTELFGGAVVDLNESIEALSDIIDSKSPIRMRS